MKISKSEKLFFENLAWTHKIHEKQAEVYEAKATWVRYGIIFATIVVFVILVSPLSKEINWWLKFGLALFDLFLVLYEWGFRPQERFEKHKETALKLLNLRNKLALKISDLNEGNISKKSFVLLRDEIKSKADTINELAPQTSDKAVKMAGKEVPEYLKSLDLQ